MNNQNNQTEVTYKYDIFVMGIGKIEALISKEKNDEFAVWLQRKDSSPYENIPIGGYSINPKFIIGYKVKMIKTKVAFKSL